MSSNFDQRCIELIANLGIASPHEIESIQPLTGGVTSDIGMVTLANRKICVKFALAQLRVKEVWQAPVHRNKTEYDWLEFAATCVPLNVPQLFGWSEKDNGFAMEFLEGEEIYLWKGALLQAQLPQGEAAKVGKLLGRIHATSTKPDFDQTSFHNQKDFQSLRLEPYLTFLATKHLEVADPLNALAQSLYDSPIALVHGDVSPKNILFRNGAPILLDAECATMGDPCFDVAFCLNHLILKSLHLPVIAIELQKEVGAFWAEYQNHVIWEEKEQLEARVAALLPALMLARVDGKSPVEYLEKITQETVRQLTIPLIKNPVSSISDVIGALANK